MKLNLDALRQLESDVGAEMMPLILEQFSKELSGRSGSLLAASQNRDLAAIQAEAHSVKSTARTVGLDELADAASAAEAAAMRADIESAVASGHGLAELCEQGYRLIVARNG